MAVFTLGPITSIEIVLFDTEETDDIEDQKILLHVFRKMARGQDFICRDRTEFLVEQGVHLEPLALRANLIGFATGSVVRVQVAPAIKTRSVWVGAVCCDRRDGERPWVEPIHAGPAGVQVLFPRRFVVMDQKDTALPVNTAVRSIDQVVGCMVGVRGSQPLQNGIPHVRFSITVGIFQKQQGWT